MPYDPSKPIKILTGGPVQTQVVPQQANPGFVSKAAGAYGNYLTGIGKGALSTLTSLSGIGESIIRGIAPKKVENILVGEKRDKTVAQRLIPESARTPMGTAQAIGFGAEQIVETILPLSKVARVERAIDTAFKGSKLLRVGAKVATEAAAGGATTLLQTGDVDEAKKSAALFGGTKAATGVIGETLRATKIPEWLYTRIFKNNYKDMVTELRRQGTEALKRSNPQQYAKLVDAGIVTESAGKAVVNETLAKEALERGLKGSIDTMANQVVSENLEMEYRARNIAKGVTNVSVPKAQKLADVLLETAQRYENVGGGEVARKAKRFAQLVRTGKLNGEDALKLRRFLDGMRMRSSFDTTANTLSQGQENFRYWSDTMRAQLAKIKNMAPVMDEYRYTIEALESLGREAARRGNNQVIGLIDSLFLGLSTVEPTTAATMGLARRAINDPRMSTNIAQGVRQSGNMSKIGQLIKEGLDQITRGDRRTDPTQLR